MHQRFISFRCHTVNLTYETGDYYNKLLDINLFLELRLGKGNNKYKDEYVAKYFLSFSIKPVAVVPL